MLARFVASVLALLVVSLLPLGVRFDSLVSLLLAAVALGLANLLLRPFLLLLTLPLTVLTFGLFALVVNALVFLLVAWVVPGFRVHGFWSALFGSLGTGVLSSVFSVLLRGWL